MMNKYFTVGECCEILDSKRVPITASNRKSGQYPYYGANGVQDYVADYIFNDELVLLAEDGGNFGSKDRPIAYRVSGKCWVNNHAHVLKPKDFIDVDYLCYSLAFYDTKGLVNGATRQKLTQSDMRKMKIPALPFQEQHHIAAELDSVCNVLAKQKQHYKLLDELVKSKFYEMFGDPIKNGKGWEIKTLADICNSIVRGPFGSALKKDFFVKKNATTYKVYEQKNAIQKKAEIGTYYITQEKYKELKRFECVADDFIMSCSGTMGELYQLPIGCEKGIINQALCKFTLNSKTVSVFFLMMMKLSIANLETKGSGIQNIGAVSFIKSMPFILPPLPLQQQFADFVTQVEQTKTKLKTEMEQTETLYKAHMQKYFGGQNE